MHEVAVALRAMREQEPLLAGLCPDGTNIEFRLDTDLDSQSEAGIKSVLAVKIAGSEVAAVVPYAMTEEITVHPAGDRDPLEIIDILVDSLRGKMWQHDKCMIHRHECVGVSMQPGTLGMKRIIEIRWEGDASWR